MSKEMKITLPEGCEIEKVEIVDGRAVATFRIHAEHLKLPKTWFRWMIEKLKPLYGIKKGGDNE